MPVKILSTYVAAGYTLSSKYSGLFITSAGGIGGTGFHASHYAAVYNYGKIHASGGSYGVDLTAGGRVINGSFTAQTVTLEGYGGIVISGAAGFVDNDGTILAQGHNGQTGVLLFSGGEVANGQASDTRALIQGGNGVTLGGDYGAVYNFGTIKGLARYGVSMSGTLTNGSVGDTAATILGAVTGVDDSSGTVNNFGTIAGQGGLGVIGGGVYMNNGGRLANGGPTDAVALIEGYRGVVFSGAVERLANYGTIAGQGVHYAGLYMAEYGVLTNGDSSHTEALIQGGRGLDLDAGGSVTNFGAIEGLAGIGVLMGAGGSLTNGGNEDRSALIHGQVGVDIRSGIGTITNAGTIEGAGAYSFGAEIYGGGRLTNGSVNNAMATISGRSGVRLAGGVLATNFGVIAGLGDAYGAGAYLSGGALTNGSAGHAGALVEGYSGVVASGGATVTNFGTIEGAEGVAVRFADAADVLVVEAGCAFVGQVLGGGGTLDLDTGTGKLTGLLVGGTVTVAGSMAATTFQDFDTVEIGKAASFATSGAVTLTAARSVIVAGSLTLGAAKAAVANAGMIETLGGTITVKGAVTGAGQAIVDGGLIDFTASFNQRVAFAGTTGTLELARSQTYTATISGFSKHGGTLLDLDDIAFGKATTASYSGTKTSGVLTVTDGTHTAKINLKGNYLNSTFVAASDGHGGTLVHDPAKATAAPSPHPLIAAMSRLGAGGAGAIEGRAEVWRPPSTMLAKPAAMAA